MNRQLEEAVRVLKQRRDYLKLRADAKRSLGWEFDYDERERDALTTVIAEIEKR